MTSTANQLVDGFLAHRAGTVTARTVARDRLVLDALRDCLDSRGPVLLDEFTGHRLARAGGGIGLCDLVDVDAIIMGMEGFLEQWLPEEQRPGAARTLRRFVLWLQQRGELDPCNALSLQSLTMRYAPVQARPRASRPPGSRRR